jgi:hypothetical protein
LAFSEGDTAPDDGQGAIASGADGEAAPLAAPLSGSLTGTDAATAAATGTTSACAAGTASVCQEAIGAVSPRRAFSANG